MGKTTIQADLKIDGNLTSTGAIDINGDVTGDIEAAELDILSNGRVKGTVKVETAQLRGSFEGALKAGDVELQSQAKVDADIECATLTTAKGARLHGDVKVTGG
ncbi:bactofilin family protein [Rhodovulum sp. YNF3179]|uniref:bactofilin family protein n=1 Tax=Rhodovulum sp. YNF3179 TaxID=3425127 RepID=UPI003D33DB42